MKKMDIAKTAGLVLGGIGLVAGGIYNAMHGKKTDDDYYEAEIVGDPDDGMEELPNEDDPE